MIYSRLLRILRGVAALMTQWQWPIHFPSECPPSAAMPASGVFYRAVKNTPPRAEDFCSVWQQSPQRAQRMVTNGERTLCETMGLSLYADLPDFQRCVELFPKIGDRIAIVKPTGGSGKILATGVRFNSHHTWWVAQNCNPAAMASVISN